MFRLILVLFAAAALSGRAYACTYLDFNIYQGFYEPSVVRLAREATTIDWIDVRATGPQRCPSSPDPMFEREKYLAWIDGFKSRGDIAGPCSFPDDPEPGMFAASVVERLKGHSPAAFELYYGVAHGSDVRFGFADVRELSIGDAYSFYRNQRVEADQRHTSLDFWYRAVVDMPRDGTNSCGGRPAFSSYLRYIVFRDARGAVMSYAPVKYQDDVLLTRLRQLRDAAETDIRSSMRVDDYFRRTTDLVLGRIVRCDFNDVELDRRTQKIRRGSVVVVERGDATFLADESSNIYAPLEKNEASFVYLSDHFKYRGEPCPNEGQVLIAALTMSDAADAHSSWRLTDQIMKIAARILDPEFGSYYLADGRPWMVRQPIRVSPDRRVRLSDIQSGLRLEGPDSVSVDDIFRWHDEGQAARKRR